MIWYIYISHPCSYMHIIYILVYIAYRLPNMWQTVRRAGTSTNTNEPYCRTPSDVDRRTIRRSAMPRRPGAGSRTFESPLVGRSLLLDVVFDGGAGAGGGDVNMSAWRWRPTTSLWALPHIAQRCFNYLVLAFRYSVFMLLLLMVGLHLQWWLILLVGGRLLCIWEARKRGST